MEIKSRSPITVALLDQNGGHCRPTVLHLEQFAFYGKRRPTKSTKPGFVSACLHQYRTALCSDDPVHAFAAGKNLYQALMKREPDEKVRKAIMRTALFYTPKTAKRIVAKRVQAAQRAALVDELTELAPEGALFYVVRQKRKSPHFPGQSFYFWFQDGALIRSLKGTNRRKGHASIMFDLLMFKSLIQCKDGMVQRLSRLTEAEINSFRQRRAAQVNVLKEMEKAAFHAVKRIQTVVPETPASRWCDR